MSWIVRLDEIKVTRDDVVAQLSDRIRVAWAWHQVSEVSNRLSGHLVERAGIAESLQIARSFWELGAIDACEIADALCKWDRATQDLEAQERYPRHVCQLGVSLLFCIINPDPRSNVNYGDPICRLPVDPGVIRNPAAFLECVASTTSLVSYLGMSYADLQLWWQGAQFDPAYEEYYDELQAVFFRFSQTCFDTALKMSADNLIEDAFATLHLDWELHRPLPQIANTLPRAAPPSHEQERPIPEGR
jgi:hypothetical protein